MREKETNAAILSASIPDELVANREYKDSVFRNLFSDKNYMYQLYKVLHPEDDATIDELEYVTLERVLVHDIYNDLGIRVGDRLLIMVEAQATLTDNIVIRCLMYLMRTYQEYFKQTQQSLYGRTRVHMPIPELYVIYTGDETVRSEYISLSEAFFDGQSVAIDARVKILTDGQEGDILNQYVRFTRAMKAQIDVYGQTRKAVEEAIHYYMSHDILKDYLETREKEVTDIMITLYDQKEVLEDYVASERREAEERGEGRGDEKRAKSTAVMMYKDNMPLPVISKYVGYGISTVEKWLGLSPSKYDG